MRIILAGATGLVGGHVLSGLLARDDVTCVTTTSRRQIEARGDKHFQIVAPMADWPGKIAGGDFNVAISCLGTTIKAAGSQAAFAAIDHGGVVDFASVCRAAGAKHFLLISSVGADAGSRNFYLSTKGKAEADVSSLGYDRLDIFRPGLLVGHRSGPVRPGERVAMAISPLTDLLTPNVLSRYRSTSVELVSGAVCALAGASGAGAFIHYNDEMRAISSETD